MTKNEMMMLHDKRSYILFLDKMEMIYALSDEQAGKLIKAINTAKKNKYKGLSDPLPDFSGDVLLQLIFTQIQSPWEDEDKKWLRSKANLKQYKNSQKDKESRHDSRGDEEVAPEYVVKMNEESHNGEKKYVEMEDELPFSDEEEGKYMTIPDDV